MPSGKNESPDQKQRITFHAMQALGGVLAEAEAYREMADRNLFLMIVSSTLIKATHHLNLETVGPESAAQWAKQHLETLGPLLSKGSSRQIAVQVTVR